VLEKAGFQRKGTLWQGARFKGGFQDCSMFGRLPDASI
jgi:RimJ/RimL family protein N-acetyltransferase